MLDATNLVTMHSRALVHNSALVSSSGTHEVQVLQLLRQ